MRTTLGRCCGLLVAAALAVACEPMDTQAPTAQGSAQPAVTSSKAAPRKLVQLPAATKRPTAVATEPAPKPSPKPVTKPKPVIKPKPPAKPKPAPVVKTDPMFATCKDAKAAGYGPYQQGKDPEYDWYQDRDGDGIVCE